MGGGKQIRKDKNERKVEALQQMTEAHSQACKVD